MDYMDGMGGHEQVWKQGAAASLIVEILNDAKLRRRAGVLPVAIIRTLCVSDDIPVLSTTRYRPQSI